MILSPQGENDLKYPMRLVSTELEPIQPQFWGVKVQKTCIGTQNLPKIYFFDEVRTFPGRSRRGMWGTEPPTWIRQKKNFLKMGVGLPKKTEIGGGGGPPQK